ncbi:hypothetical protein K458DRAFT_430700 [Lentithecium fluviatile CBS 122367]|uniref:Mitochondrial ribosomal protein-like protein n=1 Tax=Lentithecium fluviatile CBS 122367 TaxID=1168545 RepID=A0A6G1J4R2_9PLEO|nr:hypothetical protein K458DRAFT_430700 [Lentithecium fluviatile CBS 122367]
MATALRTGASRAGAALSKSPKAPARRGGLVKIPRETRKLMLEMHKGLYPQMYDANGKPKESIEMPRTVWRGRTGGINRTAEMLLRRRREEMFYQFYRKKLRQKGIPYRPAPDIKKTCPDPISAVTASQIALLDPTGARTRLFAKDNPECARVGDILLVRQRTGDPFAGVCINIRRRGVDTAILLRGQLTRVGVEMWYKVYSPLVEGIEVVQRRVKRARRARLTYMRKVKHDRGSVENVVRVYLRQKAALGSADGGKKKMGAAAGGKKGGKKGKKR